MKHFFWLLLAMGAGLTLFSARPESKVCVDCGPTLALPDFASLWSGTSKMKLPYPPPPAPEDWRPLTPEQRLDHAKGRLLSPLKSELAKQGLQLGAAAFIRVFKESKELELWLKADTEWKLFRVYPIAAMSGSLGPKLMEGDGQAPEGIYSVTKESLNPGSSFHFSFNIGYPNAYDQQHGRTGSFIMVHGNKVSIGCFAMTDPVIEEIYLLVEATLAGRQAEIPVHVFPFRMTAKRLAKASSHPAFAFWQDLQPIYAAFNSSDPLPQVAVRGGRYVLESGEGS